MAGVVDVIVARGHQHVDTMLAHEFYGFIYPEPGLHVLDFNLTGIHVFLRNWGFMTGSLIEARFYGRAYSGLPNISIFRS